MNANLLKYAEKREIREELSCCNYLSTELEVLKVGECGS
jgi:hypothetical protein